MNRTSLFAILLLASGPPAAAADWNIDHVRSTCIPLHESDQKSDRDCVVAEFGELAAIGQQQLLYALYQDHFPGRGEPRSSTHYNVLVLFTGVTGSDQADVLHVRQDDRQWWVDYSTPVVLDSARGPILHSPGCGIGDSRSQYSYDEYWLWHEQHWQPLDVWSWDDAHLLEFLPTGHHLDGISKTGFDLPGMRYVGSVRRSDDCHNCATGGQVTVHFEWEGLALRVRDVEYRATSE